jgi:adenosylhomocysteine nucleosidase
MLPDSPQDLLVVFALESESGTAFADLRDSLLFTGVGKINATHALTRRVTLRRPRLVLSLGTAGSPRLPTHSLVECTRFVQRDMDARGLGFALGATPMDPLPPLIELPRRLPHLPAGLCGSGDSFVMGIDPFDCDVVDMEAYALAKVCAQEGIDFLAVKYITDGGDQSADRDWIQNLPRAAASLRQLYDALAAARKQ